MMYTKRIKSVYSFIVVLVLFHIINNIIILAHHPYYHQWEKLGGYVYREMEKLDMRYGIAQIISTKEKLPAKFIKISGLLKTPSPRPKLSPFIAATGDLVFGERYSIHIIHALYYLLLLLGTYLVSKEFYGKAAGIFSTYLVSFYPAIFDHSRSYQSTFPLVAFFIFTLYLLLCTDNFKSTLYSIIFAIFSGLGILIKGTFLIFLLLPLLFYSYYAFKDFYISSCKAYRQILNLAFTILIATIISSLWWRGNLGVVFSRLLLFLSRDFIKVELFSPFLLPTEPYGFLDRILYNANLLFGLIITGASEILFLVFIFALFLFLRKKPKNNILIFSLILPLIVLYFSKLKMIKYLMPIFPLMAIVTSAGLFKINNRIKRKIIISLVCIIAFIQFFVKSYLNYEFKFKKFYNDIYAGYNDISGRFTDVIIKQNISLPNIVFVSDASRSASDLNFVLENFIMKKMPQKIMLRNFRKNIDTADFMVLLFDRMYFFRIATILEEGRKSLDKRPYLDLCRKYLVRDKLFYENMIDKKKFNSCIYNMKQSISKEKDRHPLDINERLLILEAIKIKAIDIEEAKKQCNWIPNDISLWSNIYNEKGIEGLIQDLTLSPEEFKSWLDTGSLNKPLLRDERWRRLYKIIKDYKFIIVEQGSIPSLGVDFYLFLRTKY